MNSQNNQENSEKETSFEKTISIFEEDFMIFVDKITSKRGMEGFNTTRDVVDSIVVIDQRYIYKHRVKEAIKKFIVCEPCFKGCDCGCKTLNEQGTKLLQELKL